jgi:hypothetical protein
MLPHMKPPENSYAGAHPTRRGTYQAVRSARRDRAELIAAVVVVVVGLAVLALLVGAILLGRAGVL